MTATFVVNAEVLDIRKEPPRPNDVFLVDTNVCFWLAYPRSSEGDQPADYHRTKPYIQFIKRIYAVKAGLRVSPLSLAELAHLIEQVEYQIFKRTGRSVNSKEFRRSERPAVASQIRGVWKEIVGIAALTDLKIDSSVISRIADALEKELLDGYDAFLRANMRHSGISQILTDDADFGSVEGIQVFTCNTLLLDEASKQGKCLKR